MKTKFLLSIAMGILLLFTACSPASEDPYKGLVKKDNNYFLVIDEKSIPVDSGINYENAVNAYRSSGALCPVGKRTKRVDWSSVRHYEVYALYNGKRISVLMCNGEDDWSDMMFVLAVIAVLGIILVISREK